MNRNQETRQDRTRDRQPEDRAAEIYRAALASGVGHTSLILNI